MFRMESDELLVEMVRKHPELYDMNTSRYSDSVWKNIVWADIGRACNKSGEHCKNRWLSLRAQYRKVLRKRKRASGQGDMTTMRWKYDHLLSFLRPYMKDKDLLSSISFGDGYDSEHHEDERKNAYDNGTDDDVEMVFKVEDVPDSVGPQLHKTSSNSSTTDTPAPRIKKRTKTKSNRVDEETPSAIETLMQYIVQHKDDESTKDPIDAFFSVMAQTVKTFSPADKHLVKRQVFSMVSAIEVKYVNGAAQPLPGNSKSAQSTAAPSAQLPSNVVVLAQPQLADPLFIQTENLAQSSSSAPSSDSPHVVEQPSE